MASGVIAPISTSKGAGLDVDVHQFQYPGEGDAQVRPAAGEDGQPRGRSGMHRRAAGGRPRHAWRCRRLGHRAQGRFREPGRGRVCGKGEQQLLQHLRRWHAAAHGRQLMP
jgi:hypothetical protein